MSHITIIISKVAVSETDLVAETSYDYRMPVPHGATPTQVGALVRQAFRHLEGDVAPGHVESEEA